MREVLFLLRSLFTSRLTRWWVLLASLAAGCTALPLLSAPGYELSAVLTLLLGLPGLGLCVAASRALPRSTAAAFALALWLTLATLPALAFAAWRAAPCDPFFNWAFAPVLLLPTALLSAALGGFLGRHTRRWWTSTLAVLGAILVSALSTCWPIVFGPQVFAFNHLGGYLPGPLYDEELSVTPALLWFRLGTVLLALAFASRRWSLTVVFLLVELNGTRLGFRMNDDALAAVLGGRRETPQFILFYPRGFERAEVDRIVGDLSFRVHQNTEFFGGTPAQVRVWWYPSAEEKQRLVGAAHTQFAKPWRHEIHVNALGFPHPVIKHELVHAMAAPWGGTPFGVPLSVGVVEGLAVAADNPFDELTLHEWAAAMKKKALLPDVAALMSAQGFYGAPPSRAYATAGSFLRYLAETRGKDRLRDLYRDADFQRAYGEPLEKLAADYVTFLDAVPLEPNAVALVFARFHRGSLFDRPCAREVNALAERARELLGTNSAEAQTLIARCRALQPDEPAHVLMHANALRRGGDLAAAAAVLDSELSRLEKEPSPWADAALARVDLAVEQHDLPRARELLTKLLAADAAPAIDRTAHVRLEGLELPAINRYFRKPDDAAVLLALAQAGDALPVHYLLGRRLQQLGDAKAALPHLQLVLNQSPPRSLERETRRLAIEAAYATGNCALLNALAQGAPRYRDWVDRCAFAFP